jgi:hypothetical protein
LLTELHPRPRDGATIRALSLQRIDTTPKNPLEDDDEDDYEREAPYCTRPEAMLIANANMTVLNKNDNRAWTNDKRRIPLEVMDTSDT